MPDLVNPGGLVGWAGFADRLRIIRQSVDHLPGDGARTSSPAPGVELPQGHLKESLWLVGRKA